MQGKACCRRSEGACSPAVTVQGMAFGSPGDLGTAVLSPRASPITWTAMTMPRDAQGSCTPISLLPCHREGNAGCLQEVA